jgi:hypothetical protein
VSGIFHELIEPLVDMVLRHAKSVGVERQVPLGFGDFKIETHPLVHVPSFPHELPSKLPSPA